MFEKINSFQQTGCHQTWKAGRLKDKTSAQINLKDKYVIISRSQGVGKMLLLSFRKGYSYQI